MQVRKNLVKGVVQDFLKTLVITESRRKFKEKLLMEFLQYVEETEELPPGYVWDIKQSERILDEEGTFLGRCPITSIPFFEYLSKKNLVVSPNRYNEIVFALRKFGGYLADEDILLENPAFDLESKSIEKTDISMQRLSKSEANELLVAAYNYNSHRARNFTLVLMLLSSAARIGEINLMKESDFFEEKGVMYCSGKSKRRTRFAIPGLSLCKQRLLEDPERIKALEGSNVQYLFYSEDGGPLTTKEANKILKELAASAGITRDISSYWLRRTFATMLAESGLSTRTIQYIFDHDKLRSTEMYIAEYIRYDLRDLVDDSTINQCHIEVGRKFTIVTPRSR